MFGRNELRKQELGDGWSLQIKEIFHTIQGEGPFAGLPSVFVRLAGCNLKCWFCDTDFEAPYETLAVDDIYSKMLAVRSPSNTKLAVLTGGEPLRQNIIRLCELLLHLGWQVQVETAGTLWSQGMADLCLRRGFTLVCSPKTPKVNIQIGAFCRDWKYIIRHGHVDLSDGLPIESTQVLGEPAKLYRPTLPGSTIWVQACDEYDEAKNKLNLQAAAESAMRYGYRLSYQLHKAVGLP